MIGSATKMIGSGTISKRHQQGFTLIEMIIVCAIIAILLGVSAPIYKMHVLHAHEVVLKEDLRNMREQIDQYSQDKMKAPQDLNDLVTAGYLHAIPIDPFTHAADWQVTQEDVMQSIDQTQPGISDVHSSSNLISSEGTAYSTW